MLDNILHLPVPMQFLAPSISTCGRTKDISRHKPHKFVCKHDLHGRCLHSLLVRNTSESTISYLFFKESVGYFLITFIPAERRILTVKNRQYKLPFHLVIEIVL